MNRRIKLASILLLVAVLSGCIDYNRAVDRQLEKENAAIAAQVENAQ